MILATRFGIDITLSDEIRLYLRILFIRIPLFSDKKKKFDPRREERKQKKRDKKPKTHIKTVDEASAGAKSLPEKISMVYEIVRLFLKTFSKYLRLKVAKIHIRVATQDAASTAILYGAVCSSLAILLDLLDEITNVRGVNGRSVSVEPDFLRDKSVVDIDIRLSVSVLIAIIVLTKTALRYFIMKNKSNKTMNRKRYWR